MLFSFIFALCAVIMFVIGIAQKHSQHPVTFYSGEEAPPPERIKDVKAWNKKHGSMWIVYGLVITLGIVLGTIVGDSPLLVLIALGCVILPLPVMIWYHHKLMKAYFL